MSKSIFLGTKYIRFVFISRLGMLDKWIHTSVVLNHLFTRQKKVKILHASKSSAAEGKEMRRLRKIVDTGESSGTNHDSRNDPSWMQSAERQSSEPEVEVQQQHLGWFFCLLKWSFILHFLL